MQLRDTVERYYSPKDYLFRWRYRHRNGHIMADSGQGYVDRRDAKHGANVVTGNRIKLGLVRFIDVE